MRVYISPVSVCDIVSNRPRIYNALTDGLAVAVTEIVVVATLKQVQALDSDDNESA